MSSRKAPAQQELDEEYLRSLMAAPEPAASSSDTEVSEQAETPASEPRVRRSDAEDYAEDILKIIRGNWEKTAVGYGFRSAAMRLHRPAATPQDHDPRGRCGQPAFYGRELHRQRIGTALRAAPNGNTVALLQRTQ